MSERVDLVGAILALFFVFWLQGGWYRVDCVMGQASACSLIAAEYAKEPTP